MLVMIRWCIYQVVHSKINVVPEVLKDLLGSLFRDAHVRQLPNLQRVCEIEAWSN